MEKIKLKISDMFCQHCVKTKIGTQADFQVVKRNKLLSLSLIGGILIMLFSIIGCSDTPYTGQVLTVDDMVNRYLVSTENTACLYNGVESSCLTLRPPRTGGVASNAPIIHVHPRKLIYTFYYEGKQIVHAERVIDTTEIVAALQSQTQTNDQSGANNPPPPPPPPPVVRNPPPPPPPVVRNPPPPPPPPPPPVRNPPPNNGGNNGGTQQPVTRTATTLEVFSGNGQSAETDRHLTNPLIVRVLDQNSAVLSGVTVSFSVTPSSGVLTPTSATTGSDGQASTTLQLGGTAGTYTVTASVSGITQQATFTTTATEPPRAATLEQGSGDGQTGETGHHLTDPLIVTVLDQYGNPLSGVTVSFSVTPTDGVLSPASVDTDSDGEASTLLQLGGTVGEYIVTANVPGVSSVTFTATATAPPPPPPPARVATTLEKVSGDSQTDRTNQHLTNPLIVKVIDQDRDALSDVTVSFTVNPSSGVLSPTSATTDADGQASTALQLGGTARTYTVTASVSGLSSVTFTATATEPPRAATLEVVSGNNQEKEAYQHLPDPLVVEVRDQYGAALPDATVNFSVNPSVGVLNPASATTDADGQASTILRFGKTTGAYTVTVTATGINQSVTFTATATVRPTDSDWAQQSHYYDANQSKQGWLVWIYYPENYTGPLNPPTDHDPSLHGFETNGFMLIPSDGATVTEFAQTQGACYDADKPCHIGTVGDWENSTTYSVQIFLETTQDQASVQVIWDRKDENWSDNSPPPDMTYNLMSSKNMMLYTDPMYDPDHTQQ